MDTSYIADQIANGHAYKHVERGEFDGSRAECGGDLDIQDREDFKEHIQKTLDDPRTKGFIKEDGQEQYYNEDSNTFVGFDERGEGTCFRPTSGASYIEGQALKDGKSADDLKPGGYQGLEADRQALNESSDQQSQGAAGPARAEQQADQAQIPPPPPPPPPPEEAQDDSQSEARGR